MVGEPTLCLPYTYRKTTDRATLTMYSSFITALRKLPQRTRRGILSRGNPIKGKTKTCSLPRITILTSFCTPTKK